MKRFRARPPQAGPATAVPTLFLSAVAMGLAMPGAVHGVVQPFPTMAGTASAVQGFMRTLGAALSSALVALLNDGSPLPMTLVMSAFAAARALVWAGILLGGRVTVPNPVATANRAGAAH